MKWQFLKLESAATAGLRETLLGTINPGGVITVGALLCQKNRNGMDMLTSHITFGQWKNPFLCHTIVKQIQKKIILSNIQYTQLSKLSKIEYEIFCSKYTDNHEFFKGIVAKSRLNS